MNIFKFVINPHDFGQSVENLFYLSFLIRDGKCAFFTDEATGEPVIRKLANSVPLGYTSEYTPIQCYANSPHKKTIRTGC